MIQRAHGARLALESLRKFRLRDFNGDKAVETCVAGLVYFPHSARPDGRDDLIGPQPISGS